MSAVVGYRSTLDKYRERTNAMPPIVLRPKRCACGKRSTAKQLAQYGVCVGCAKARP